jgi:hypothetical protein
MLVKVATTPRLDADTMRRIMRQNLVVVLILGVAYVLYRRRPRNKAAGAPSQ